MPPRSAVSVLAARTIITAPILPSTFSALEAPPTRLSKPAAAPCKGRGGNVLFLSFGVSTRRQRPFHTTVPRRDEAIDNARNHYETLKVSPGASPADIKKSFYSLSKTHHPDVHELSARRAAAKRFMRISEAYAILSSPTKRAKYDREHMDLPHPHPQNAPPRGSYSSTGPAGGRPASGLSRRRGTFQGPPPSFFRSGGWGSQGEKRRAAHEASTGGMGSSSGSTATDSGTGGGGASSRGGMGPGQDPFGHRDDVPHFDREGHQRTGRHIDKRREARRASADAADGADGGQREGRQRVTIEPERGIAGTFFAIGGVIVLSFMGPFLVSRLFYGNPNKPKKA
ncbi:hypothetical protein F4808DRAFT_189455 [Astrocystis sublimbata]|nr:hypothetical protein F4808DRAFT_189455 [Astrocystis sublimbata]